MHNPLLSLKFAFAAAMFTLISLIIGGAYTLRHEPRLQGPALVAMVQQAWYTMQFGVHPTAFVTTAFEGITVDNTVRTKDRAVSVPVLVYHGIISNDDRSSINITQEQFKEHIMALWREGYTTVSLEDLAAFVRNERSLPDRSIVITFDDGRSDSYYGADPILAAAGYEAVMFPISKFSTSTRPGGYYLTGTELRRMAQSGRWTIGSHSHDGHADFQIDESGDTGHYYGNLLWLPESGRMETMSEFRSRVENDFMLSQSLLTEITRIPIYSFAFPFGDLGQDSNSPGVTETLIDAAGSHYSLLMYQQRPGYYFTQAFPDTDRATPYTALVRRIDIHSDWDAEALLAEIERGSAKPLPYIDTFATNKGWVGAWGSVRVKDGALHIAPNINQLGASTILDGTAHWRDVIVNAEVESPRDTGFLIWGRFLDEEHNVGCNYGDEFVHIEQTVDGEKRVIKGYREPNMLPDEVYSVEMEINGRTVTCSINHEPIVRTEFLDESLTHGGIGIKVWDETPNIAALTIHELSAVPAATIPPVTAQSE